MTDTKISRRSILKGGAALLAAIPVMGISTSAFAAKNASMRTALKYVDKAPDAAKSCDKCGSFLPATKGCQMMPGDTEIAAAGTCTGWNPKKK